MLCLFRGGCPRKPAPPPRRPPPPPGRGAAARGRPAGAAAGGGPGRGRAGWLAHHRPPPTPRAQPPPRPPRSRVARPAFSTPPDRHNERWHELNEHPQWLFYDKGVPSRAELYEQRDRLIARHPDVTFICAHFANDAEDLAQVARWLDARPNMMID